MILLDTHVLVFDALAPSRLSRKARGLLAQGEEDGRLACSDVSLREITILVMRKRLQIDLPVRDFLDAMLVARGIRALPFTPSIAGRYVDALPESHRYPADRAIAATTLAHGAVLVTKDATLRAFMGRAAVW